MPADLPPLPPALYAPAAPSSGVAYTSYVEEVVRELLACEWGMPIASWRERHPPASERRRVAAPISLALDDRWDATLHAGHGDADFYVLLEPERAMCRLQRYRWDVAAIPAEAAARLHAATETALAARFGRAERPAEVDGFGSADWHEIRRWRPGGGEILLYVQRDEPDSGPTAVHVVAKSPRLLREMADDWERRPKDPVIPEREAELAAALRPFAPAAAAMLRRRDRLKPSEAVGEVASLIRLAARRPRPDRPIALIAADRLLPAIAFKLGRASAKPSTDQAAVLRRLASMGLALHHFPDAYGWDAPHKLFYRAALDYQDTEWGQWAYIRLLQAGAIEPHDPMRPFHGVIQNTNAFLTRHPGHKYRPQLDCVLGMAYETWWALCQPKDFVPFEPTPAERDGADLARQLAIKHYQDFVAAIPPSRLRDVYRWQAQRLELGYVADNFWYVGRLH